jgi:hypothetical protein
MSEPSEYRYDVAFSFLAEDEALATQLSDLLQDRLKIFLYSRRQGEIAGTDGEKTFNAVFGEQARLVVVLYRSRWGQTPWTRIEETAIRNRAFENGYDFVKFIPLDDNPSVPKWLPRAQIWLGLRRWGVAGTASVIEARVEELGGEVNEESALERASRFERSRRFKQQRQQFLKSESGVKAANTEFEKLTSVVEGLTKAIVESTSVVLKMKKERQQFVILGLRMGLSVEWRYRFLNTLDGSRLYVSLWNTHPPFPGIHHFDEPKLVDRKGFDFDLLPSGLYHWKAEGCVEQSFETEGLADHIVRYYIEEADSYQPDDDD